MKKKAQKFSFIMMIVFFLTGIAMTIVAAVTVGTGFGTISSSSWDYDSSFSFAVNPFAKYVFPVILCGLVGTFSITAIWWAVLEHFKNVEKGLDQIYRSNAGKEELPDSAYSYIPTFAQGMTNRPAGMPVPQQPPYQPYPPQYGQPGQPGQQIQPIQPPMQPAAPAPAQQASADWFCPNCGATNMADANFCLGCGRKKD